MLAASSLPPYVAGVFDHRRFGLDGDVEAFLSSVADSLGGASTGVTTHVVWDPISPAEGIRTHLREHPAAFVVVGSRSPRPCSSGVRQRRGRHRPRQPVARARRSAALDVSARRALSRERLEIGERLVVVEAGDGIGEEPIDADDVDR